MPFIHGKTSVVLIGSVDLSGELRSTDLTESADVHETTTYGDGAKEYIVGLQDGTLSLEGLWDGDTDGTDEELQALIGATDSTPITFSPDGSLRASASSVFGGKRCYLLRARGTTYNISSPVGDLVTVTSDIQADKGVLPGIFLKNVTTGAITTINFTSQDNGASTSTGSTAFLHVYNITSSLSSVVIKVQHSTDNSTWVDLITFTTLSGTTETSEVKTTTGTVNQYVRLAVTGGSGAAGWTVSFARVNNG